MSQTPTQPSTAAKATSRARSIFLASAAGLAIAAAGYGFLTQQAQSQETPTEAEEQAVFKVAVTVASPAVRQITEWDEYSGRFAAVDDVEIRARVSGYLTEVAFEDGDIVEKGELLFKIDPRPFHAALAAAEAERASAAAAVENAKLEEERGRRLLESNAVSAEVADRRTRALLQAEAAYAAANAQVDQAKLNLEFTEIRSPINGRISDNYISEGNLITGGASGGTLLTSVVSIDPIYFEFTASEADYLKYTRLNADGSRASSRDEANPVRLKLLDENDFSHEGRMSFVDNRLDLATGTMRGRATFPNPDGIFAPGMFGRLQLIASGEYEAVLVPDSIIQTDQSEKFVWVVSDDARPVRTRVELGPIVDGLRIVRRGLTGNEKVIVAGHQFVTPSSVLDPTEADAERLGRLNLK